MQRIQSGSPAKTLLSPQGELNPLFLLLPLLLLPLLLTLLLAPQNLDPSENSNRKVVIYSIRCHMELEIQPYRCTLLEGQILTTCKFHSFSL